eukprot:356295-Pelagomonas_calceolata.AAC.5
MLHRCLTTKPPEVTHNCPSPAYARQVREVSLATLKHGEARPSLLECFSHDSIELPEAQRL